LLVEFLAKRNERHHDFEFGFLLLALHQASRFENRATLHARDFRKHQAQATAAEAEHRVGFANAVHLLEQTSLLVDFVEQVIHVAERSREAHRHLQLAELAHQLLRVRKKLMQRRIEQTNRYRQTNHLAKDADKIPTLKRQQFFQRFFSGADTV